MSYVINAAKGEYAGDPGLFSTIGKIGKTLGGLAGKVIPAVGIAGAAVGIAKKIFTKPKGKTTLGSFAGLPTQDFSLPSFAEPQQGMPGTGIQVQFPRVGPVGGGGIQMGTFQAPQQLPAPVTPGQPMGTQLCVLPGGGQAFRRTHANKSGYFTHKEGRAAEPIRYVAPGTKCVPSRRMNPLNPHALHRAMKRIVSAKRAATFLSRITVRSACKTRAPRRRSHGAGCACKSCKR